MNAAALKAINDAFLLINTLGPLVQQAMNSGKEVTVDELRQASANLGVKIDALDALIAQKEQE